MINKKALYKAREDTKKEILEKLEVCDRFGVVRPVGFGKSHIIMELCNILPGRKLIIEPRNDIIDYIKKFGEYKNTDFMIYHNLLIKDFNHESLLNYDYIFLDEMHRAATKTWGKILLEDLKEYKGKLIGFSATPERTDGKNPIETIFNDEEIEPLYLVDAIKQEILPQITYVSSIYQIDYKYYKDKALVKKLSNYNIDKEVKNIFSEFLDYSKPLHIAVFVSKISEIEEAKKFIKIWIKPKINEYMVHTRQSNSCNFNSLNDFYSSKKGINILYSVNMFNEGIHIKNLDAVVFLRKTVSDIIYNQQLGRIISEHRDNAVVFDLVNNAYNLNSGYYKLWKDEAIKSNTNIKDIRIGHRKELLKIFTRQEDLIKTLFQRHEYTRLPEEIKELIIKNAKNMTLGELMKLTGLSSITIRNFCYNNKIEYKKEIWNIPEETKELIRKNAKNMTITKLSKLTNLSESKVRSICNRFNIKYKKKAVKITPEIEKIIREKAKDMTIAELANLVDVNPNCLRNYCNRHNILFIREYMRVITPEIKETINKNAKNMTFSELSKLTGIKRGTIASYCSNNQIKTRLERVGTTKLSEDKINKILLNPNEPTIILAKKLNISTGTVYKYRNKYKET